MTIDIHLDNMAITLVSIETKLNSLANVISEEKMYKANFICEEILTNLARHADFEERDPHATLSLVSSNTDTLTLLFSDNSKPFNLLTFPDPQMSLDIDEREIGGLGIFLTKKYAKVLEYYYEDGYNMLKVIL
jgi:anti-sigma regulatory factor (Ser/Thr protein kinase)